MRSLLLACALLMAVQASAAETRKKTAEEPFSAFRALDQRFTDLQEQFRALEASLQADEKELSGSHSWVGPAKNVRRDIRAIEKTAHHLRLYYRHSHFGRRAFLALETKAKRMRRHAGALVRARGPEAAKQASEALSREMLPLIVQFQALTANYGALHCELGQTACCQPKKRESAEKGPEHECRWMCVEKRKACVNGIAGPTSK